MPKVGSSFVTNAGHQQIPGRFTVSRDGNAIVMRIPVRFYRKNGRQMVLTHGGNNGDAERESSGTLVCALAKAYRWQEQLESGEFGSLEDLAARQVDRTYVGRILRLTSLAPDVVEAILNGDEPEGISLAKLRTICVCHGPPIVGYLRERF